MIILKILAIAFSLALVLGCALALIAVMKHSKGNTSEAPDFLLILGCRVRGEKAEETLQMRIDAAAEYLNKNKGVTAIPCGGIVHKDQFKSEAQVIAEQLIEKGVEKERIILEDKSTTTRENFINAKNIIDSMNLAHTPKTAFLSSEFHLFRSEVLAKEYGLNITSLPAPSPKKQKVKNYLREMVIIVPMYIGKTGGSTNGK